jgi:hypothetical protein
MDVPDFRKKEPARLACEQVLAHALKVGRIHLSARSQNAQLLKLFVL